MKRKFEALSWSEWNWQRPFSEENVKSLLGQLVGLTRRKSIVFEDQKQCFLHVIVLLLPLNNNAIIFRQKYN